VYSPSAHENREVNPHGARGEIYFRCSAANTKGLSFFYIISPRYIYSFILSRPVFFNFGPPICLLGLATALLKAALRRGARGGGWCATDPFVKNFFSSICGCEEKVRRAPALTRLTWSHGEWSFLIYLRTSNSLPLFSNPCYSSFYKRAGNFLLFIFQAKSAAVANTIRLKSKRATNL
jgi:hypothetical protein